MCIRDRAGAGTKSGGVEMSDFSGGMGLEGSRLMKDQLTMNYDRTEDGDGRAEIVDLGLFDERGNITNLLLKGEMFTIKERIHFNTCLLYTSLPNILWPDSRRKNRAGRTTGHTESVCP